MILWRFSWREWLRRPLRTVLTLVSIIIGVAAVESVMLATSNARVAQTAMLQAIVGQAALEISAEGGAEFDASSVEQVAKQPGVKAVVPSIRRFCSLSHGESRVRAQVLGINPKVDRLVRDSRLTEGTEFSSGNLFMLDESFAKSLKIQVGDTIRIATLRGGIKESKVAGFVQPRSGANVTQGSTVMIPLSTAQSWFRSRGRIDSLQVVIDKDADIEKVRAAIAASLPVGLNVRQPNLRSQIADELTTSSNQGLMLATAFALVIAIFIIYNTFQMNVGERRRQLGMLRAIGTTRGQIVLMIVREGLILGLIGTLLGSIAGWYGAKVLSIATTNLLQVGTITQYWSPFALASSIACGLGVAAFGAYFPARRAGRLSPAEAMKVVTATDFEKPNKATLWAGITLAVLGFSALVACSFAYIPVENSVIAAMVGLIGLILILPVVIDPLTRMLLYIFRGWWGVSGRLAQRQLMRHRVRSSMTIGILFIAISTGLGMASTILDNIRDVERWYKRSIVGDFFVRAAMPDMATGKAADLPLEVMERIRALPGIKMFDAMSFVNARSSDFTLLIVAREFISNQQDFFDLVDGDEKTVIDQIRNNEVVIGSVFAERSKLHVGDELILATLKGDRKLRIAATTNDYLGGGLTAYMNRPLAEELFQVQGADALIIQADPAQVAQVETSLREICLENGLIFQSYRDLISYIQGTTRGVVAGLWVVLGLGSLIAAFGLINTLAMNILEQTREIGLLRVVAMTRSQIRKMIMAQAIMMGLIALIPGIVVGLVIAYLINISTLPVTGHAIEFVFRPWLIVGAFGLESIIILLAALVPAERAARLRLSDALQYE